MKWDDTSNTTLRVFNWHTGEELRGIRYETRDPVFTFHHANAYEKDDHIVMDFSGYRRIELEKFKLNLLREKGFELGEEERGFLTRLVLPLKVPEGAEVLSDLLIGTPIALESGKCSAILLGDTKDGEKRLELGAERLCPLSMEFPKYNYGYNAKEYRYVYGSSIQPERGSRIGVSLTLYACLTYTLTFLDHQSGREEPLPPNLECGQPRADLHRADLRPPNGSFDWRRR